MTTEGIDVSQYQGIIDWNKVKNHIDFAILRCGYGQDIHTQQKKRQYIHKILHIKINLLLIYYFRESQDTI